MKLDHFISTAQIKDQNQLAEIFKLTDKMSSVKNSSILSGKILATLFFEPSTRTRLSFETAMIRLGGQIISSENAAANSSSFKGESLEDTIKVVSNYVDCIVLRHPDDNSAKTAVRFSSVPIINAGSGKSEHPTQALLDIHTIYKEFGRIDGLEVAFAGDLLNGRTVHSLIDLLKHFKNVKVWLISPKKLRLPKKYWLGRAKFFESVNMVDILSKVDLLYMTRIQKERFSNFNDYQKLKNSYRLTFKDLKKMKKKARIMHPLPRINEISTEIDSDHRVAYFRQAENGLYIRMALLKMLLKK